MSGEVTQVESIKNEVLIPASFSIVCHTSFCQCSLLGCILHDGGLLMESQLRTSLIKLAEDV